MPGKTLNQNLDRLPKWARGRIENAERELSDVRKAQQAEADNLPTHIYLEGFDKPRRYIPDRQAVVFLTDKGSVSLYIRNGVLEASSGEDAHGRHSLRMAVYPSASNVVYLVPSTDPRAL